MIKKNVWIDTDLSAGMKRYHKAGYSDVDDGYAILQLLLADHIHVTGISAVFGNTRIDDAYRLCQEMVGKFARYPIPVSKGAGSAINLLEVTTNAGVEAMAAALRQAPQTIMAIGPATNVGLLLLLYPELKAQIMEVVLVAGRRHQSDHFAIGSQGARARDLNFDLDNDAFRILLQSGVPIALCPFEISNKVWLTSADLKVLSTASAGSQWIARHSIAWLQQWEAQGAAGFNPFDVLASHYIIAPQDIISERLHARLELHLDDTVLPNDGSVYKNYLLCQSSEGTPVTYCYDVVADYHTHLIDSLI